MTYFLKINFFIFFLLYSHPLFSDLVKISNVEYFSDHSRSFPLIQADPRAAQLKIGFLRSQDKNSYFNWIFGGEGNIFKADILWNNKEKGLLTIGARGLMTSRFQFASKSFDLKNSDFIGGVAIGLAYDEHFFEVYLYHESSHLGDGYIKKRDPINLSFESIRVLYAKKLTTAFLFFLGGEIKLRADPRVLDKKWTFRVGGEWQNGGFPAYFAWDAQWKEENKGILNLNAQVGFYLNSNKGIKLRQRLYLDLYKGKTNLMQFYTEEEAYAMVGIAIAY
jgi:hypothetical protein